MDTGTFVAVLVGGVMTVLGGALGAVLLGRMEAERERKRQRERHATAVRIVVLELMGIGSAHVLHAYLPLPFDQRSTAGYNSVAADLYALLPAQLATDIAFVYGHAGDPGSPAGAKLIAEKIAEVLHALRAYGEKELGLSFQGTGQSPRESPQK